MCQKRLESVTPSTDMRNSSTAQVGERHRLIVWSHDGKISIGKENPHNRIKGISMQFIYSVVRRDSVSRQARMEEITAKRIDQELTRILNGF